MKLQQKKTNVYSNILMVSPKGTPMMRISKKKANWYLKRNLASLQNDKLILKFKPKGLGHNGNNFLLEKKECKCVICGSEKELTMHHVVPFMFRKLFPQEFVANNSYDVLPVCIQCHSEYECEADKLKALIINKFITDEQIEAERYNNKIIKSRKSLQNIADNGYLKYVPLDKLDKLEKTANLELKQVPDWTISFKEAWAEDNYMIDSFCIIWRKHFLETMNPKFLSEEWDVYYSITNRKNST